MTDVAADSPRTPGTPARSPMRGALVLGTVLQLAMVLSGHWIEVIRLRGFAVGGMLISGIAGVVYARAARVSREMAAANGALVGGACALIGIVVSYALGDVPANILILGTLSSAVTGAIGGALTKTA